MHYTLILHNKIDSKVKLVSNYRNKILDKFQAYLKINDNTNNIIIAGDFNQSIVLSEIQTFY